MPFVLDVTHQTQNQMEVMVGISDHVALATSWDVMFGLKSTPPLFDWALVTVVMVRLRT
jgi:hypothetical protein